MNYILDYIVFERRNCDESEQFDRISKSYYDLNKQDSR